MFVVIGLLILTSFFLSGSETALTAVNKMKVQTLAENNDKKSQKLLKLIEKPDELITAILIGNNISNITLPTLVTIVALNYDFHVGVATAILTVVLIIFAEVLPKSIAATFATKISYIVAPVIGALLVLFKPLTFLLNTFTRTVIKWMTGETEESSSFSREEIKSIVDAASTEGTFEKEERLRIKRVIDFYNKDIRDALKTPRMEIIGIPSGSSMEEAKQIVLNNRHTRYPVYDDNMDHIVGVFHSKLLLDWSLDNQKTIETFMDEDPLFFVETTPIEKAFKTMIKETKHLAIVIDEYGGTMGIISQEDIIEAMIGQEIEDEIDEEREVFIHELTDTYIICSGKLVISYLNEIFNTRIDEEEDIIAGFLYREIGHIPEEGEILQDGNLHFEILEMDGNKIEKVRITKKNQQGDKND